MKKELCFGPMSLNIVNAVVKAAYINKHIQYTFIPSRRQIDYASGYVHNWITSSFKKYIDSIDPQGIIKIHRDHGGQGQGNTITLDDSVASFMTDIVHFNGIHIDPWKAIPKFKDGAKETVKLIKNLYQAATTPIVFEIGTEEAIRKFSNAELEDLVTFCKSNLTDKEFSTIKYLVIQAGTRISGTEQIGQFSTDRFEHGITLAKSYNLLSKEHNGDYLTPSQIKARFSLGLNALNIAPMLGVAETDYYISNFPLHALDVFWNICMSSDKWVKWVPPNFDPEANKLALVRVSGHYHFNDPRFKELKNNYGPTDEDTVAYLLNIINGLSNI